MINSAESRPHASAALIAAASAACNGDVECSPWDEKQSSGCCGWAQDAILAALTAAASTACSHASLCQSQVS